MENYEEITLKTQEYNEYIAKHRRDVFRAWEEMQEKCKNEVFITNLNYFNYLSNMVKMHDLSKYSQEEFIPYRRKFYPCAWEGNHEEEFKQAVEHHYSCNPHHWQYWVGKDMCGNPQLLGYVEMILDWTAMGYRFNETALEYYEKNKDKILIEKYHIDFVERILKQMSVVNNKVECE